MKRKSRVAAIIVCAAALLCVYTLVVASLGWMPSCPFKVFTGWDCPGCGSQRALMALAGGHLWQAWRYNLVLPFAVAYLLLLVFAPRGGSLRRALESLPAMVGVLAVILLWWLVRNILGI